MTKLPTKSESKGIQQFHTRRLLTKQGYRDIPINIDKQRTSLPARRKFSRIQLVKRSKVKPLRFVKLKPRSRLLDTFDKFKFKLLNMREFQDNFSFVNRHLDDMYDYFWDEWHTKLKSGEVTEANQTAKLAKMLEEISDFGELEDSWGGKDVIHIIPFGDFTGIKTLEDIIEAGFSYYHDPYNGELIDDVSNAINKRNWKTIHVWDTFISLDDLADDKGARMFRALQKTNLPHVFLSAHYESLLIVPRAKAAEIKAFLKKQGF